MSDLGLLATRQELKAALEGADYRVVNGIPRKVSGQHTTVLLTPSDPYLTTEARTYATWRLHLEAWLCFKAAENDAFSAEADPLLLELLEALPPRWAVMDVAAPFSATDLGGVVVCRVRIDTLVLR